MTLPFSVTTTTDRRNGQRKIQALHPVTFVTFVNFQPLSIRCNLALALGSALRLALAFPRHLPECPCTAPLL
jgi:hypothetical protein